MQPTDTIDPAAIATEAGQAEDAATKAFSMSIVISGIRCMLAYVVFPWLLPAIGFAGGVGPGIGVAVGTVAIGFNVASIRRFQISDHRWKWHITALNSAVILLLTVLLVQDVSHLVS